LSSGGQLGYCCPAGVSVVDGDSVVLLWQPLETLMAVTTATNNETRRIMAAVAVSR
jgi:hypothetical protein